MVPEPWNSTGFAPEIIEPIVIPPAADLMMLFVALFKTTPKVLAPLVIVSELVVFWLSIITPLRPTPPLKLITPFEVVELLLIVKALLAVLKITIAPISKGEPVPLLAPTPLPVAAAILIASVVPLKLAEPI